MSKLACIGVKTEVPEYEEVVINITANNCDEYLGCGARDDNSSSGFYFFWDNNRIINTACGQRENADMSFDALCDIEKLSFRMTGCAGLLQLMPNDDESYYIPDNDFLFECSLKQDEFVFFMFQDEMYLEEGDRVFSDIQITLKKKKTNTIDITPENIDEYFVDLSNIYIGTDPSDTGNPFYWLDGKIVSAPITITDTHSLWIEFKSAINNQTISFNAVLSTPILFSIINVTVCDCDGNEIAQYEITESNFQFEHHFVNAGESVFFAYEYSQSEVPQGAFEISNFITTIETPSTTVQDVAHIVSCIYIGVPTELSYIKSPITKDNINTYFSVLNGNDYYFNWNNNALISTNNNVEGIATTTLTARMDINLVFDWSVSSEPDYDVFTIRIDKNDGTSEIIIEASGEQNGTNTCSLQSDDSITFLYEKDSSQNNGDDCSMVFNIYSQIETEAYIKPVARNIVKAYLGDVNGIAQLFFDYPSYLKDFKYKSNSDGTYTLTEWKGTYNGEPSTEIIVPDYDTIVL